MGDGSIDNTRDVGMRIWYDMIKDLVFIEGVRSVFTSQSLTAMINNDQIAIMLADDSTYIVSFHPYTFYHDEQGQGFNSVLEAFTYLVGVFAATPSDYVDFVAIFERNLN
jgi:hypothetical protein